MSILISQFIPPFSSPLCPHVRSLHLLLYSCPVNKIIYTNFFRFHIYALIYNTFFSLSDLLHSAWQSLGPSMSLQMTQFVCLVFFGWLFWVCSRLPLIRAGSEDVKNESDCRVVIYCPPHLKTKHVTRAQHIWGCMWPVGHPWKAHAESQGKLKHFLYLRYFFTKKLKVGLRCVTQAWTLCPSKLYLIIFIPGTRLTLTELTVW